MSSKANMIEILVVIQFYRIPGLVYQKIKIYLNLATHIRSIGKRVVICTFK